MVQVNTIASTSKVDLEDKGSNCGLVQDSVMAYQDEVDSVERGDGVEIILTKQKEFCVKDGREGKARLGWVVTTHRLKKTRLECHCC